MTETLWAFDRMKDESNALNAHTIVTRGERQRDGKMSYTQNDNLFASISQNAMDKMFAALYNARPRLFAYSSLSPTPPNTTPVAPISIPNTSVSLNWGMTINLPSIILSPGPAAPMIPLDSFSLNSAFNLTVYDPSTGNPITGLLTFVAIGSLFNAGSTTSPVAALNIGSVDLGGVAPPPACGSSQRYCSRSTADHC
jgi:hypothetical protein